MSTIGVRVRAGERIYTVNDASFVTISSILDIKARIRPDSWNDGTPQSIISKRASSASNFGFQFRVHSDGNLRLIRGDSSTTVEGVSSTVVTGFADGEAKWVRATKNYSTGDFNFYTAPSSDEVPTTWTQLGTTVSGSTAAQYVDTNAVALMNESAGGTQEDMRGNVYRVIVEVDGTVVSDWIAASTGIRHRDSTGKIWTITGSAFSTVIED